VAHVYANLDRFRKFLADGVTAGGDDTTLLGFIEGASRRVDAFCDRSSFGSGFGPRIGTNRYDHDGASTIDLRDDVISGTFEILAGTGGGTTALTVDDDYYLAPYGQTPTRELVFTGLGDGPTSGLRVVTAAGTFGYSNETVTLGTAGTVSSSATTLVTNGTPYGGMTLLVDSEQMYVTATSGGTATVVRARNGTTAAVHAEGATVSYYTYPAEVVSATLLVAQRRWRSRDSGASGDYGGGPLPTVVPRGTERSILNENVGHLRVYGAG
jgi:hypothetical protein